MRKYLKQLQKIDWPLFIAVAILVIFGLSVLYSVGLGEGISEYRFFSKQLVFSLMGLGLMIVFSLLNYNIIKSLSFFIYLLAVVLLVLVLFVGTNIQGTTGWFTFAGFSFQPVEVAKLGLILFLATFFSKSGDNGFDLKIFLMSLIITLTPVMLVFKQPDLGSVLVLFFVWLVFIFFSGIEKKYIFLLAGTLITLVVLSWFFLLQGYQKERVLVFLDPGRDPLGQGYNVSQSLIAVGSGGLTGKGLGLGTQSQLNFLPETEADFIFASLAEELGFVGTTLILALYLVVFWRIIKIILVAKDDFAKYTASGFLAIFFIHFLINIGMTIGLLPVTGLPLPFISSGGSFLLMSMIYIGILNNIRIQNR